MALLEESATTGVAVLTNVQAKVGSETVFRSRIRLIEHGVWNIQLRQLPNQKFLGKWTWLVPTVVRRGALIAVTTTSAQANEYSVQLHERPRNLTETLSPAQ